jgi:hypothetical protein
MNLDLELICAVLKCGKLEPVIDAGITIKDIEGDYKKVYKFLLDFYRTPKYAGKIPTPRIIERHFKFFSYNPPDESVDYIIDEIRKRTDYNMMRNEIQKIAKLLPDNVEKAKEAFMAASIRVASRRSKAHFIDLSTNAEERVKQYEERKRNKSAMQGFDTGFAWSNKLTLGYQRGDFVYLIGKRGTGKSFMTMLMSIAAQMDGATVLYIPLEMTRKSTQIRYDAMRFKLPYQAFRRGELGNQLESYYYREVRTNGLPPFIVPDDEFFEGPITPLSIRAKIREFKVDYVVIDGVYMLADDNGMRIGWEKHDTVATDLKKMFRSENVVGVVTNQMNKDEDPRYATLDNSAYGDYGRFADIAYKIFQGSDERISHQLLMWCLKVREEDLPLKPVALTWNFESAEFGESEQENETETE